MKQKILIVFLIFIFLSGILGLLIKLGGFNSASSSFPEIHLLQKIFWIIASFSALVSIYLKNTKLLTISLSVLTTATIYHVLVISLLS